MYGGGFLPRHLFLLGEEGVWYDPSDLTTLFQDSAGTTPVTADGDPVGLMLDKSGNGNHATQSTSAARPTYRTDGTLHWLSFDGVDDYLVTGNIDFTGTDGVTAASGLMKITDPAGGAVAYELSPNSSAVNGAFGLFAPAAGTNRYAFRNRGTAARLATSNTYTAPTVNVITGLGDISGDSTIIRVDGVQEAEDTADAGTGNYGNHPLYMGVREGSSFFFNGNIYGIVVRGALTDASDITSAETYLAKRTGVTLP